MNSIKVTLPDGKSVEVDRGTRIDQIAAAAGMNGNVIAAIGGWPSRGSKPPPRERLLLGMGFCR